MQYLQSDYTIQWQHDKQEIASGQVPLFTMEDMQKINQIIAFAGLKRLERAREVIVLISHIQKGHKTVIRWVKLHL